MGEGYASSPTLAHASDSTVRLQGENPRKVPTGTTYVAEGATSPVRENYLEYGSSQTPGIVELVPELASQYQRLQVYGKMMKDAGVDVSMRAAKTPVLGAEFFVEPASQDPLDVDIAEFITDNLSEGMSSPLIASLEDILHFYEDGFAVLEKVHELRDWRPNRLGANSKQYTMLRKLGVRPANTIKDIVYDDNGGPNAVVQNAIRADLKVEEVEIGIEKAVIFTFGRKGGDLTGNSLLRTAYAHWYYKTHFYKIDAIQKERHSLGVPKGRLNAGYTNADKEALRTLLRNLRTNEEAFMMLPPGVDVEFAEVKSNLVDVLGSAQHHNFMILLNVMAQFLALGSEGSGGGRATAGSQVDIYMKSLRYVANSIAEQVNMYVIPELVVWNFPKREFPKLKVRNIGEARDLQMLASALSNLVAQKAVLVDDATEAWIRQVFDMPALVGVRTEVPLIGQGPVQQTGSANGNGAVQQNGKPPQKGNIKGDRQGNTGKPVNAPD